jgi:archaeal type IV pilus assembly protein PilA
MNVLGQRERSWRKSRKRAVSPIIATILLVAITVVLAAVLYVLISGLTHGPGSTPIGSAFTAGLPAGSSAAKCPTGDTYAANGCLAGDYTYTLTIESSTVNFGSVLFEVKTATGAVDVAASVGGFSVLSISSVVVAQMTTATTTLAMTSTFGTFSGVATACNGATCSSTSPLTSIYTIVIDMGTGNPTGTGLSFIAIGTGSYSGTTSPVALP